MEKDDKNRDNQEEVKAPVVCGECKYWTEDSGNPNHALYCSKYKKLQTQKGRKDRQPFAKKVEENLLTRKGMKEKIKETILIIGLILFLIILFAFVWNGMEFAY